MNRIIRNCQLPFKYCLLYPDPTKNSILNNKKMKYKRNYLLWASPVCYLICVSRTVVESFMNMVINTRWYILRLQNINMSSRESFFSGLRPHRSVSALCSSTALTWALRTNTSTSGSRWALEFGVRSAVVGTLRSLSSLQTHGNSSDNTNQLSLHAE